MIAETTSDEAFCCIHGLPIKYVQFGARIQGTAETKDTVGEIDVYVCEECWKTIVENVKAGLAGAKRKEEKLKIIDAITKAEAEHDEADEPN